MIRGAEKDDLEDYNRHHVEVSSARSPVQQFVRASTGRKHQIPMKLLTAGAHLDTDIERKAHTITAINLSPVSS